MKKFKNKTIILLVIGILLVTTMSIGVTYSYMKPKAEKENNQTEIGINNCAKITLKDSDSTINLTNMYPMEEEMGLQTDAYEFTVSSTCEEYTGFNLYLTTLNDNEIKDSNIRYAVTDVDDNVLITDLLTNKTDELNLTEEEIKELEQGIENKRGNTYKVYNGVIPLNKDKVYKLHLWLNKNANNETMNQSFKIKVSIKGYKYEGTLAEYLIKTKDRSLIYHDGKPDYKGMENYELEAGDLSYRFAGGNDIVNNYVCFGGECSNNPNEEKYSNLYRVIGLFDDDKDGNYEVKIIKADGATKEDLGTNGAYVLPFSEYAPIDKQYYKGKIWNSLAAYSWNNSIEGENAYNANVNMWKESNLNTINLNDFYYNNLNDIYKKMIMNHIWIVGGYTSIDFETFNAKTTYELELGSKKITSSSNLCYTQGDLSKTARLCNEKNDLTYEANIGLLYESDYMYSAISKYWIAPSINYQNDEIKNNNWFYFGATEWGISRSTSNGNNFARVVVSSGKSNGHGSTTNKLCVRPTMYLNTNVKIISGTGTANNPYIIDMQKNS